ncbi:M13 family metallopeptidase [Luteibacter sp. HA06]
MTKAGKLAVSVFICTLSSLTVAGDQSYARQGPEREENSDSLSWLRNEPSNGVNVCSDLDDFANSQWRRENPPSNERSSKSLAFEVIERNLSNQRAIVEHAASLASSGRSEAGSVEEKIGLLYQSGLDAESANRAGSDPVQPKLRAIGRIASRKDVSSYLVSSFTDGDQQVFLFTSSADPTDASRQIGSARQAGLGLPSADYYTDEKHAALRADYERYIAYLFQLSGENSPQATAAAAGVVAFETSLAKASLSAKDLQDQRVNSESLTPVQAARLTPHFDWVRFFAAHNLPANQRFLIRQPQFFAAFDHLLASAPLEQWRDYLRFHVLDDGAPYLSEEFRRAKFDFYGKKLAGKSEPLPRWRQALDSVNRAMGQALGQLYVARNFSPRSKEQAELLVLQVRESMKRRIEQSEWMGPQTKAHAIDKLDRVVANVGFPDHWRSWSGLTIKPGAFYQNIMAAAKYDYWYEISQIGGATDRSAWDMNPQTVNAYYSRSSNSINFPAAMLQPPFFFPDGDDATNFGALGSFVGHELTHGFDENGRQLDGEGNKVQWWTDADDAEFNRLAKKLVEQFDAYTPIASKPNLHVNGQLTLGENIADLGGLNVSYEALQRVLQQKHVDPTAKVYGFSADQRFFLSYARMWRGNVGVKSAEMLLGVDRHAPASTRVNGPASNMSQFSRAFGCKTSDVLDRPDKDRVVIW